MLQTLGLRNGSLIAFAYLYAAGKEERIKTYWSSHDIAQAAGMTPRNALITCNALVEKGFLEKTQIKKTKEIYYWCDYRNINIDVFAI
jgi:DNA-binding MarR family transcriptional regulator